MIPWCAGGHQRNARWIESYTQAGASGVWSGTQVALGDDQPGQTATHSQSADYVRIAPGRLAKRRDPRAYQRAGSGAKRESIGFVAIVVVTLNQETITRHHAQNSPDRCSC